MKSDFLIAVTQLAAERNLPRDMVLSSESQIGACGVERSFFKTSFERASEASREYAKTRHEYEQQRKPGIVRWVSGHLP